MQRPVMLYLLAATLFTACSSTTARTAAGSGARGDPREEADALRSTERARVRSLVDADMNVARQLHADDFQLINPAGGSLTKDQYLGWVASGQIDYLYWEPDSIAVRVYETSAVLRYRSQLEIIVFGQKIPRTPLWHTDLYEKRNGRWQVVWSQATEIKPVQPR